MLSSEADEHTYILQFTQYMESRTVSEFDSVLV